MKTALYETLIQGIPPEPRVNGVVYGASWAAVSTQTGAGVSMRMEGPGRPSCLPEKLIGMSLQDLAAAILSWNNHDACLGAAAINAWYNSMLVEKENPDFFLDQGTGADPFKLFAPLVRGKRVVGIGHFKALDTLVSIGDLAILERNPREGDYPDMAAEYLLPGSDLVFITGSALANKSLPRLLELAGSAMVILVGPSTSLAPQLFNFGVSALCGSYFPDPAACLALAAEGIHGRMVKAGIKILMESKASRRKRG